MTTNSETFKVGDHLSVPRSAGIYRHHGIYVGGKQVIHYTGDVKNKRNAAIRRTGLSTFLRGKSIKKVDVVKYTNADSPHRVVYRAQSRLGENGYSLYGNNCEHFARWCKTGDHKSEQVKDVSSTSGGVVGGTAATAAGLGVVSGTGAAAGLSGAGIMSGLATVGGSVGAGAVGGVAVLGAAPAAVSTLAMRKVLEDDEKLPQKERNARSAGRKATVAGAVAGSAGSVAAISTAGSVAGLSGAGITSGLAAIGGTVGGGMAAGTALTVAAPAVAAAGVGYGLYKAWKWLSD